MILYPQLPHPTTVELAVELRALSVADAEGLARNEHPNAIFTPTGGTRVDSSRLERLRQTLQEHALEYGYPEPGLSEQRLGFDAVAAVALHSNMEIPPGEAAKPGVWEFISCILLPHLVRWRFPGGAEGTGLDRFFAGRRNVFQRLWLRAHLLRDETADNPYAMLVRLGEDELVQIMERPNLAGNRVLTRFVAREFLDAAQRHPHITPRRELLREAQKHLLRLSAFVAFGGLDEATVQQTVREVFNQAALSLTMPSARSAGR